MKQVTVSKKDINGEFERYFVNTIITLTILLFMLPWDVEKGRLTFAALLMIVLYVPAIIWIYLSLFTNRYELVMKPEKYFIAVNIAVIVIIFLALRILNFDTYLLLGQWFFKVTGPAAAILGLYCLFSRKKYGALPAVIYSLLTLPAWHTFGGNFLFIWFIIFGGTIVVLVHQSSVLIKFNKDLRRANILK